MDLPKPPKKQSIIFDAPEPGPPPAHHRALVVQMPGSEISTGSCISMLRLKNRLKHFQAVAFVRKVYVAFAERFCP